MNALSEQLIAQLLDIAGKDDVADIQSISLGRDNQRYCISAGSVRIWVTIHGGAVSWTVQSYLLESFSGQNIHDALIGALAYLDDSRNNIECMIEKCR